MRLNEEVHSKLTILAVREWDSFQVILRSLRRFGWRQSNEKIKVNRADSKKRVGVVMLMALLLLVGSRVEIQAADDKTVVTMEEVVVTATKTEEKLKDISNSVIIIDSYDIAETPAGNIGQLLSGEAGVDWRTRGNYGGAGQEIQIRGMESNETQVLVNGMSINSPSLGRADVSTVPMNTVSRIETVKGAGSLLYGSGAMAGTVNIITKNPDRGAMDLHGSVGFGSENTYLISAEQGMFLEGDIGYYLTVNRKETDGFRDNSDLEQNDGSLKLLLDKGDVFKISLYGDYIDRKFGVPGIKTPSGTTDFYVGGVRFYSAESASTVNEGQSEDGHLLLALETKPNESMRGKIEATYLYNESDNTTRYNADGWTVLQGEGLRSVITNKLTGIEGNFEFNPIGGMKVLLGADYKDHGWDTISTDLDITGQETGVPTLNSAKLNTRGSFVEFQYRPFQFGKIIAGVRHEKHSTFGYENMPHYGLIIDPLNTTSLKVNHGKFFKAPTPNDLFWPEDDFARGNPNLEPQTGWHTDATVEQSYNDNRVSGFLTYFNWNVDDKIEWAPNPAYPGPWGDKWTPTNLTSSEGDGWELGLALEPVYSLSIALSCTYTDAVEESTPGVWRKAQYVAKDRYKVKLAWRSDYNLTLSGVLLYVGSRGFYRSPADTVPTDLLESYTTLDLRAAQQISPHLLLVLDINNLFDTEYETYLGTFVDSTGSTNYGPYPGSGQSIFASLSYEF